MILRLSSQFCMFSLLPHDFPLDALVLPHLLKTCHWADWLCYIDPRFLRAIRKSNDSIVPLSCVLFWPSQLLKTCTTWMINKGTSNKLQFNVYLNYLFCNLINPLLLLIYLISAWFWNTTPVVEKCYSNLFMKENFKHLCCHSPLTKFASECTNSNIIQNCI